MWEVKSLGGAVNRPHTLHGTFNTHFNANDSAAGAYAAEKQ